MSLFHFSEDGSIETFVPRLSPNHPRLPPAVWAIDAEHAPLYFFPRDCPRVAFWKRIDTTEEDIERFYSQTSARMVIAVEGRWLQRIQRATLYVYRFEQAGFRCFDEGAGYYINEEIVIPKSVQPVGDLVEKLVDANVELRVTPSLFPLQEALLQSSLHYSMIRMRNALQS